MLDKNALLRALTINGLSQKSASLEDIEKILFPLGYSEQDKVAAFQLLQQEGWTLAQSQKTPSSTPSPAPAAQLGAGLSPQVPGAPSRFMISTKVVLLAIAGLLLFGGMVSAYVYRDTITLFNLGVPYTEENFLSALLEKSATIKTNTYRLSVDLHVGEREEGALPFITQVSNEGRLRELYQNDSKRAQDVSSILSALRSLYGNGFVDYQKKIPKKSLYPVSLESLAVDMKNLRNLSRDFTITDPTTGAKYVYQPTADRKNFTLQVTFEQKASVRAIKRLRNYAATSTPIVGSTVIFTKDSNAFLYLPSNPPKPLLVQLGETARLLPVDTRFDYGVEATADWGKEKVEWVFNMGASGSFGDLSYAVDIDALKKDSDFYFKINKMPSFFIGAALSPFKGKWVKVSAETASSTANTLGRYNSLSSLSRSLPKYEKNYKENRENFTRSLRAAAAIANEEGLIGFRNKPLKEVIEKENFYRYELMVRKEKILPFYQRLVEELGKDGKKPIQLFEDEGVLEYLQSKEFEEIFDYLDKNAQLTLWVDTEGYPRLIEYKMRIIPPDTATHLREKQVNLTLRLALSDINEAVVIEAPQGAVKIEELIKQTDSNTYSYASTPALKTNLSTVRAQAEIIFDATKNSYGSKAFPLGICRKAKDTLFGDATLYGYIENAAQKNMNNTRCISTMKGGKVDSYAISVSLPADPTYSWCIDSAGRAEQIRGHVTGSLCR